MTPEDLLIKASETITQRGKASGSYEYSQSGEVCAYGAMTLAATEGRTSDFSEVDSELGSVTRRLIWQAAELLAKTVPSDFTDEPFAIITWYNDQETTTAEDMALAFKRAAAHDG